MMTATIPATRSGLSFPVTITLLAGEDHLAPMVRSFLSADDKMDWSYVVTYDDGSVRRYTFDGAEVVRGSAYIPGGIDALRAAFVAYRDETHGTANDTDDEGNAVVDNLGYAPSERKAINRRDAARRKVAAAMGFNGIKAWKAAGSPVNWDTVRGSVKTAKAFDTIKRESDLTPGGTIPVLSASIVRPTRLPGQYQGHSHNN